MWTAVMRLLRRDRGMAREGEGVQVGCVRADSDPSCSSFAPDSATLQVHSTCVLKCSL